MSTPDSQPIPASAQVIDSSPAADAPEPAQAGPRPQPQPQAPAAPERSGLNKAVAVGLCVLSAMYLLNPTAGILEFIPDNIPLLGNLDEGTAIFVLLGSLRYLGVRIPLLDTILYPDRDREVQSPREVKPARKVD